MFGKINVSKATSGLKDYVETAAFHQAELKVAYQRQITEDLLPSWGFLDQQARVTAYANPARYAKTVLDLLDDTSVSQVERLEKLAEYAADTAMRTEGRSTSLASNLIDEFARRAWIELYEAIVRNY